MTKKDLIEAVYRCHGGISRRESAQILERLLARMKGELARSGRIQISGFGRFEVVHRVPRRGRNPQTGERIQIEAREALVFRPSQVLMEQLNRPT